MTIETTIAENTAAIIKLTAVWAQLVDQGVKASASAAAGEAVSAGGKVVKQGKPAAPPADSPAASTASSKPEKELAEAPTLEYVTVQKAIVALAAKHGRAAALAALEPFGVANGKELKPEQWAAALAAVLVATVADAEVA